MSQPSQPQHSSDVDPPAPGWAPPPAPDRVARTPAWPTAPLPARPPAAPPARDTGSLVVAAVAGAAVLSVGLVVAALLSALVLSSVLAGRAEDVGRGIGSAMSESAVGTAGGPLGYGYGPVEQTDPVPPGPLGTDPALDGHARECFAGALAACDELYVQSAPLSEYERYGSTCGGRVKPLAVYSCTELE